MGGQDDVVYTRDQVARDAANGAQIFIIDGGVYDFSTFAHPGGKGILLEVAGEDVSEIFRGHAAGGSSEGHEHSATAHRILHRLRVGRVALEANDVARSPHGQLARTAKTTSTNNSRNDHFAAAAAAAAGGNLEAASAGGFEGAAATETDKSTKKSGGEARVAAGVGIFNFGLMFNRSLRKSAAAAAACASSFSEEATVGGDHRGGSLDSDDGEQLMKSSVGSDDVDVDEDVDADDDGAEEEEVGAAAAAAGIGRNKGASAMSKTPTTTAATGVTAVLTKTDGVGDTSVSDAYGIDPNKPLVPQVGFLGDRYMEWVHIPEVTAEPLRFFGNPVMEALSRTKWWAVPLVWLPIALWALHKGVHALGGGGGRGGGGGGAAGVGGGVGGGVVSGFISSLGSMDAASAAAAAAVFAFGWFFWGFMEYSFHRFVFHGEPKGRAGITLHFILHGCHHKAPMDGLRLVFPPAASAPIIYGMSNVYRYTMPNEGLACFAFAGCLMGYVAYDCTHYFLHHATFGWSHRLSRLKSTHMAHHYKDCDYSFGITNTFFDRVFGTKPGVDAAAGGGGGGCGTLVGGAVLKVKGKAL